jgi:predicted house-cleaning noncanonical NTP pyrophosphatase (MazG superfamily)
MPTYNKLVRDRIPEDHGISIEELERVRHTKAKERGGFQEKIFLIEVED